MKIFFHLAKENTGWIIEKIMTRLISSLNDNGFESTVNNDLCEDNIHAHLYMHYLQIPKKASECESAKLVFVYHVNDLFKFLKVLSLLLRGFHLLTMSTETAQRIQRFTLYLFKNYISTVGIASDIAELNLSSNSQRVVCGISSHTYPDGRKNENWVLRVSKSLNPSEVRFEFIGKRWTSIAEELRKEGFDVSTFYNEIPFENSYSEILERIKTWDIALYLGFDEGSLGILDAVLLSKDVLVSAQGFHLELGLPQESLFRNYRDFCSKLNVKIGRVGLDRKLHEHYSWPHFARQIEFVLQPSHNQPKEVHCNVIRQQSAKWYCFNYYRLRLFWINSAKSLRFWISRKVTK